MFRRLRLRDATRGNRGVLLDLIRDRPGISFLALVRETGLHFGATQYHLDVLQRFGLIRSFKTNRTRRYYVALGPREDDLRHAFAQERHLAPVIALLRGESALDQKTVTLRAGGVTRQAVGHRLKQLASLGLVTERRIGRSKRYSLADVPALRPRLGAPMATALTPPVAAPTFAAPTASPALLEAVPA